MMNFSSHERDALMRQLQGEMAVLISLRELTQEQAALLAADDIDAVNASLDRRQKFIEEFERLHQETEVLMQSYISSQTVTAEIDGLLTQIRAELAAIAAKNDENGTAAKVKSGEYGKDISKLNLGRRGIGLYNQTVERGAEYFDKKT